MSQFTTLLDYRRDAAYQREIADLRAKLDAESKRADVNRDALADKLAAVQSICYRASRSDVTLAEVLGDIAAAIGEVEDDG